MVRPLYHDRQEVPAVEEREINLLDNNFDQDEVYILNFRRCCFIQFVGENFFIGRRTIYDPPLQGSE